MSMIDVQQEFKEFDETISLNTQQLKRMESTEVAITAFLVDTFGLSAADVFRQGSAANGTAIEPLEEGEYDLDLVAVCATAEDSSDAALERLEKAFKSDGRYAHRVQSRTPCIRLEYAEDDVGKFHVDVVPVRTSTSADAPLEAPRKGSSWHLTAPAEYTEWCRAQGDLYARTVRATKRWRDEQQNVRSAIKSIVLQVLVARHMPTGEEQDASRLASTLLAMNDELSMLSSPPWLSNPVLESENLAARWTQSSFENFKRELSAAAETVSDALSAATIEESCDHWRALLGDDFPLATAEAEKLRLSDKSHIHSAEQHEWVEELDTRYSIRISARAQRGKRDKFAKSYHARMPPLITGNDIKFEAEIQAPSVASVWWQVGNTGGHARSENGLRGEFFRARARGSSATLSNDETINWESTRFTGVHLIRAVLVVGHVLIASSQWLEVNVINPSYHFRP